MSSSPSILVTFSSLLLRIADTVACSTKSNSNVTVVFCFTYFFLVPASLDMNPVNMTVNESSPASFRCNASGDPKPVVTWFKGGSQLAAGNRIVIGGDSLTILNTTASDAGQYSCNVSNGLNSHVGIAYLLVQGKKSMTSHEVK